MCTYLETLRHIINVQSTVPMKGGTKIQPGPPIPIIQNDSSREVPNISLRNRSSKLDGTQVRRMIEATFIIVAHWPVLMII